MPALLAAVFQCNLMRNATVGNATHGRMICEVEAANRREDMRLKSELAAKSVLETEADSVLSGLLKDGQNPPDVSALGRLRVKDAGPVEGDNAMLLMSLAGALEYHAFVPALNQQEASSPMMRCKRLSLKNTGKPFYPSALPLHVDLEVAFPKLPAGADELARNVEER